MAAVGRALRGNGSILFYRKKTGQYVLIRRQLVGYNYYINGKNMINIIIKRT